MKKQTRKNDEKKIFLRVMLDIGGGFIEGKKESNQFTGWINDRHFFKKLFFL
jgi:hypothetical protein